MRIEIVAVGTELLLGQIADTNGAWLGEHLAAGGVASHFHQVVGDNLERIVLALRTALARSDGVIVCGGLGPTHDDITREAIAEVMNVGLVRDEAVAAAISAMFASRGRTMPPSNLRQADRPEGASIIPQTKGTAPGLVCPLGQKVIYAVPGVPYEMADMFERGILPDLQRRMAERGELAGVIASRVVRTWGMSESALADALGARIAQLDTGSGAEAGPETEMGASPAGGEGAASSAGGRGRATIAFLASGIEGIKVRLTVRAATSEECAALLDAEEAEVRRILREVGGDVVFGVDEEAIEDAVARSLVGTGWTLGVAESLTGGLISSRLVNVPGASAWFRGAVVSYATEVKTALLGVPLGPVVSEAAARAMAEGAQRTLGATIGLSVTGVAGPDRQDDRPPGTLFIGLALPGVPTEVVATTVPGDRHRVRQYATISALDLLRRRVGAMAPRAFSAGG
ncbi:MAG: nicotinamide-nucleotide amidohydrolase family protein [Actinomycetota bacterium]|jgi:nicotinamide-nucleotide amidase|nr:nicotinamide-nucleotide amidohydrolase family protein [Actinomycetota bacterium]